MEASLRAARHTDEAQLFALTNLFPTPTPSGVEVFRHVLHAKLADPSSSLIVAERNDHLVGYVSGSCHSAFYAGGRTAWVDEVLVAPEYRGRGLGKRLMSEFERWAASQSCVLIALATRGAAEFYGRLAYTSTAGYFKKYLETVTR